MFADMQTRTPDTEAYRYVHTARSTDARADAHTDIKEDIQTCKHTGIHTHRQPDTETDMQAYRYAGEQRCRHTGLHADRHADRRQACREQERPSAAKHMHHNAHVFFRAAWYSNHMMNACMLVRRKIFQGLESTGTSPCVMDDGPETSDVSLTTFYAQVALL